VISQGTAALAAAQMAATLDRLDTGAGTARVRVYSTTMPLTPGAHSDTPMSTVVLPKPAGAIVGATLVLASAEPALVMTAGTPRWAELVAADGVLLHAGDVTDAAHDGFWRVSGADTPEGETSPPFQAGGLLSLGAVVLT
jgi:hypothetical protein